MAETVWLNGQFLDRADARVSAFDAALQHGVGLFETMLATCGRVFRLERHMARLAASARELGLSESLKPHHLGELVEQVVERSQLAVGDGRARVRLTLTGGDLNLLVASKSGGMDPTLLIAVSPATGYPEEMFSQGVGVLVPSERAARLEPGAGHKTVNYWWRLRALRQAAAAGMGECLILQDTNHLCGGAVSNVFLVKGGVLLTPFARGETPPDAPSSPVLPGVTRGAVIEFAADDRTPYERAMLSIQDALEADEVFLTNSSWGILPVTRIEAHVVQGGVPGPLTRRLRAAWLRAIREEP